ncbi:restriction endonuclease subunit S [Faecalibacterium longum]|uniref:Restriction endonuclease subunit S n=2 Tax=Faecalibacterium TaxID=216851 RepID=A0ABV1IQE6_9FIRM|nr:restriction endonuclease subunit S [Faecalibacterium longum]MCC2183764.1 restriction endonuclease subunit S [Faecalibacterium longum CLA-AA-H236]
MKSEWTYRPLGELVSFASGGTPSKKRDDYWGGTIPWISAKTLKTENIDTSDLFITEEGLKAGSKIAPKGSILLLTRGSGLFNGIPIARVEKDVAFNQDIKCLDSYGEVENEFIFYWLLSQKDYLMAKVGVTGIGAGKFDLDFLQKLMIPIPSERERKSIVGFASSISEKIRCNAKVNDNLYAQVKAIFSENFLDLDFLPDGWKTGNLLDIADYLNGLAMQKYRPKDGETGLPVLKIKELRQGICDASSELCSPSIKSEYIIHDGDIIFSWSGSLLVDIWCGGTCGLNQHLFKVTSNNYDKWFYYLWTAHHLDRFIAVAADKATTMGHIKREELEKVEVIIPSKCDYKRIGALIKPLFDLIISNRIEDRKLTALRNTLLPKIMSGEIDVCDIQL